MTTPLDDLFVPFEKIVTALTTNQGSLFAPFVTGTLKAQLAGGASKPSLNLSVAGLPDILNAIPTAGAVLRDFEKFFQDLFTLNFGTALADLKSFVPDFAGLVHQQLGVGLSLLAVARNAATGKDKIGQAITEALQAYFFDDGGFKTLEGGSIAPPSIDPLSNSNNAATLADIEKAVRSFSIRKTAEQYVRDLVRITGEASGDALYGLRDDGARNPGRYSKLQGLKNPPGDTSADTKKSWFKGLASLAESTVTSAVEQAAMGVSTFSTNPLIAASLGTFAGTAARKATQHFVLAEFGL